MKTLKDMLAEARQIVPEELPTDVQRRLQAGESIKVIDVRDPDEYRDGHIDGAANISRGFLEFRVGTAVSDPATPVVLYYQTGLRSVLGAKARKELGYSTVINLQGGYQKWVQSGLPVVRQIPMTGEQIQRYSRHFLLSQVGEKGQQGLPRVHILAPVHEVAAGEEHLPDPQPLGVERRRRAPAVPRLLRAIAMHLTIRTQHFPHRPHLRFNPRLDALEHKGKVRVAPQAEENGTGNECGAQNVLNRTSKGYRSVL